MPTNVFIYRNRFNSLAPPRYTDLYLIPWLAVVWGARGEGSGGGRGRGRKGREGGGKQIRMDETVTLLPRA